MSFTTKSQCKVCHYHGQTKACHNHEQPFLSVRFVISMNRIKLATIMSTGRPPVAEWVRSLNFSALNHLIISPLCLVRTAGVSLSPTLATCETSQVLLAGVSGGFPGILLFCPTYRLARLDMSEIILKGTLN